MLMARYYFLLLAFNDPTHAETGSDVFRQQTLALVSGRTLEVKVSSWTANNLTWVIVEPIGVSMGVNHQPWVTSVAELDEVAQLLYQTLFRVEHFLCAIAGWEVADFFLPNLEGYQDLRIDIASFTEPGWEGLVMTDGMYAELERPAMFQPFCPGYVWRPYRSLGISGW